MAKAALLATFGKTAVGTIAMADLTLTTGALAGAAMGALIYALAFLPIHDKPDFPLRSLIVTLAINLATLQMLLWHYGPTQKNLQDLRHRKGRIPWSLRALRPDRHYPFHLPDPGSDAFVAARQPQGA